MDLAVWRKSSYSGNDHGMCVELVVVSDVVAVEDAEKIRTS